ncbi:MAG: PEP-CTERM sorting domain-containing protein [Phycisphaerae bacterium]
MRRTLAVAVTIHLLAGAAVAGLVDGSGQVIGWGVTPFTQPNQASAYDDGVWRTIANDYAPINYPSVGYRPSPGGSTGEGFDLEELYVRPGETSVDVLLVASNDPSANAVGNTWYLGDLMLTLDGRTFGIVTSDVQEGLAAGSVYRLDGTGDVTGLQVHSRSYRGDGRLRPNDYGPDATIPDIMGGFAVSGDIDPGQLLGTAGVQTDIFDYGGVEDATHLLLYTFDPAILGLSEAPEDWLAQVAWGCGNDVIRVEGSDEPHVPEPATVAMLACGVALTWWTRRRGRRG